MKGTIIAIIIGGVIIAGTIVLTTPRGTNDTSSADATAPSTNNVYVEQGVQVIEIGARGGYIPERSVAKVGIPTTLRFTTRNTFDCSAAVSIPSLGVSELLPQTGTTDFDAGIPEPGVLKGSCGMGMYPFEVVFE